MRPTKGGGIVLERDKLDIAGALKTVSIGLINFGANFAAPDTYAQIESLGTKMLTAVIAGDVDLALDDVEADTLRDASKIALRNTDLAMGVAFSVRAERQLQPEDVIPAMQASGD